MTERQRTALQAFQRSANELHERIALMRQAAQSLREMLRCIQEHHEAAVANYRDHFPSRWPRAGTSKHPSSED